MAENEPVCEPLTLMYDLFPTFCQNRRGDCGRCPIAREFTESWIRKTIETDEKRHGTPLSVRTEHYAVGRPKHRRYYTGEVTITRPYDEGSASDEDLDFVRILINLGYQTSDPLVQSTFHLLRVTRGEVVESTKRNHPYRPLIEVDSKNPPKKRRGRPRKTKTSTPDDADSEWGKRSDSI